MIKKFSWIIALFSLSYAGVVAQQVKFGFITGFDISNSHVTNRLKDDDSRVYYPISAFNINAYLGYKSSGFWGISIEPGFIQKGGLQKDVYTYSAGVHFHGNIGHRFHYLQLPTLANFYIDNKLSISIGPEFSYMISAKGTFSDATVDIYDSYDRKFELSGLAGLSYAIFKNVDVALRYSHGLTYVTKIEWRDPMENYMGESKEYNQYFQVMLRFTIKGA